MSNRVILPPKLALETVLYSQFDFLSLLASASDSVTSIISTSATVYSGIDPNPGIIIFSTTLSGTVASVLVQNGIVGVIYEIAVQAALFSGQRPILRGYLAVIPDLP